MEIFIVGKYCTAPLNGAVTWLPVSVLSAPHALKSNAGSGLPGWVTREHGLLQSSASVIPLCANVAEMPTT